MLHNRWLAAIIVERILETIDVNIYSRSKFHINPQSH